MTTYPNDDARWDAMRAKDRAAEGAFYIGVHTTGVYCVASCGGRPLRKNVAFYATREDARAAGLRACLRCKPDLNRETLRWAIGETSLGFSFSLDKVADLDLDFQDLARADVRYLKVGAQMMLDQLEEQDGKLVIASLPDLNATDFAALTRRYGIEVIVEKVEAEKQIVDILDLDIGYGQGHLFGEPRAIRDAVLAEAEPPADFIRGTLRRRAVGW